MVATEIVTGIATALGLVQVLLLHFKDWYYNWLKIGTGIVTAF